MYFTLVTAGLELRLTQSKERKINHIQVVMTVHYNYADCVPVVIAAITNKNVQTFWSHNQVSSKKSLINQSNRALNGAKSSSMFSPLLGNFNSSL